jgi:hypothetical protein
VLRFDGQVLELFGWGQVRSARIHVLQITEAEIKEGEGVRLFLIIHVAGFRHGPPTPQSILMDREHRPALEQVLREIQEAAASMRGP